MNYFTATIPPTLAEKLKEKGMPIRIIYGLVDADVTYGLVFDWLMERGYDVDVYLSMIKTTKDWTTQRLYAWVIGSPNRCHEISSKTQEYLTWHEAANAAIEKAITLI